VANPREMAAKLRLEYHACEYGKPCDCDAHNAQVDALLAAIDEEMRHGDRLAEALREVEWAGGMYDPACPQCNSSTAGHLPACILDTTLSAHRARRGGR